MKSRRSISPSNRILPDRNFRQSRNNQKSLPKPRRYSASDAGSVAHASNVRLSYQHGPQQSSRIFPESLGFGKDRNLRTPFSIIQSLTHIPKVLRLAAVLVRSHLSTVGICLPGGPVFAF